MTEDWENEMIEAKQNKLMQTDIFSPVFFIALGGNTKT
jgi:hypothetical protein